MNVTNLFPKISYKRAREKMNSSDNWRNFARRIVRNQYVFNYLLSVQSINNNEVLCKYCKKKILTNHCIHHIDYDHVCKSADTISAKTHRGFSQVPDCQNCHSITPSAFNDCVKRLVLVHKACNHHIAIKCEEIWRREEGLD